MVDSHRASSTQLCLAYSVDSQSIEGSGISDVALDSGNWSLFDGKVCLSISRSSSKPCSRVVRETALAETNFHTCILDLESSMIFDNRTSVDEDTRVRDREYEDG